MRIQAAMLKALFSCLLISLIACIPSGGARSDGLSATQLQALLAAAPGGTAATQEKARATAAEAAIAATAAAAVRSGGGDASQTIMLPTAPGASNRRTLAARGGERPAVADFAAQGSQVGGAAIIGILQSQATTDHVMWVAPIAQLNPGVLVTSPSLPAGTSITGIGPAAATSLSEATSALTQTDAEEQALATMSGLSNQLAFSASFAVPVGAAVSGNGIAAGTTVIGSAYPAAGGTLVYLSANVSGDVASGAVIGFKYTSFPVYLSNSWSAAVAAGTQVGIAAQDDAPAFQNAAFFLAPQNGGAGGRIFIPSGTYFLSRVITTYDGVSFELGPAVGFVPASQTIDTANGGFSANSDLSLFGGYRDPVATTVNISQAVYQGFMPSRQGQALLVNQVNVNCTNDGSISGCGIVAAEVKQGMAAFLKRGTLWGYHETDTVVPGQNLTWAGAEIELLNDSGIDNVWNSVEGNKTGLHIDNLGNTPNTVVLLPGGNIPQGGGWHRVMDCPVVSVRDYCFDIQNGPLQPGTLQPVIVAALDMTGKYTGTGLAITGDGSVQGTLHGGVLRSDGSVISAPAAASYTLSVGDCGTTLEPAAATAVTIAVPSGLPLGCAVDVDEVNAQTISFSAGAGMTMRSLNGASRIAGNYGSARILLDGANAFLLSGQIQ